MKWQHVGSDSQQHFRDTLGTYIVFFEFVVSQQSYTKADYRGKLEMGLKVLMSQHTCGFLVIRTTTPDTLERSELHDRDRLA